MNEKQPGPPPDMLEATEVTPVGGESDEVRDKLRELLSLIQDLDLESGVGAHESEIAALMSEFVREREDKLPSEILEKLNESEPLTTEENTTIKTLLESYVLDKIEESNGSVSSNEETAAVGETVSGATNGDGDVKVFETDGTRSVVPGGRNGHRTRTIREVQARVDETHEGEGGDDPQKDASNEGAREKPIRRGGRGSKRETAKRAKREEEQAAQAGLGDEEENFAGAEAPVGLTEERSSVPDEEGGDAEKIDFGEQLHVSQVEVPVSSGYGGPHGQEWNDPAQGVHIERKPRLRSQEHDMHTAHTARDILATMDLDALNFAPNQMVLEDEPERQDEPHAQPHNSGAGKNPDQPPVAENIDDPHDPYELDAERRIGTNTGEKLDPDQGASGEGAPDIRTEAKGGEAPTHTMPEDVAQPQESLEDRIKRQEAACAAARTGYIEKYAKFDARHERFSSKAGRGVKRLFNLVRGVKGVSKQEAFEGDEANRAAFEKYKQERRALEQLAEEKARAHLEAKSEQRAQRRLSGVREQLQGEDFEKKLIARYVFQDRVREMREVRRAQIDALPEKEKGRVRKMLEFYGKQPIGRKAALTVGMGALAGAGVVALAGGGVAAIAAGGAGAAARRGISFVASSYGGRKVGLYLNKKLGARWEKQDQKKRHEDFLGIRRRTLAGDAGADLNDASFAQLQKGFEIDEHRARMRNLKGSAIVGGSAMAAGAGTAGVLQALDSVNLVEANTAVNSAKTSIDTKGSAADLNTPKAEDAAAETGLSSLEAGVAREQIHAVLLDKKYLSVHKWSEFSEAERNDLVDRILHKLTEEKDVKVEEGRIIGLREYVEKIAPEETRRVRPDTTPVRPTMQVREFETSDTEETPEAAGAGTKPVQRTQPLRGVRVLPDTGAHPVGEPSASEGPGFTGGEGGSPDGGVGDDTLRDRPQDSGPKPQVAAEPISQQIAQESPSESAGGGAIRIEGAYRPGDSVWKVIEREVDARYPDLSEAERTYVIDKFKDEVVARVDAGDEDFMRVAGIHANDASKVYVGESYTLDFDETLVAEAVKEAQGLSEAQKASIESYEAPKSDSPAETGLRDLPQSRDAVRGTDELARVIEEQDLNDAKFDIEAWRRLDQLKQNENFMARIGGETGANWHRIRAYWGVIKDIPVNEITDARPGITYSVGGAQHTLSPDAEYVVQKVFLAFKGAYPEHPAFIADPTRPRVTMGDALQQILTGESGAASTNELQGGTASDTLEKPSVRVEGAQESVVSKEREVAQGRPEERVRGFDPNPLKPSEIVRALGLESNPQVSVMVSHLKNDPVGSVFANEVDRYSSDLWSGRIESLLKVLEKHGIKPPGDAEKNIPFLEYVKNELEATPPTEQVAPEAPEHDPVPVEEDTAPTPLFRNRLSNVEVETAEPPAHSTPRASTEGSTPEGTDQMIREEAAKLAARLEEYYRSTGVPEEEIAQRVKSGVDEFRADVDNFRGKDSTSLREPVPHTDDEEVARAAIVARQRHAGILRGLSEKEIDTRTQEALKDLDATFKPSAKESLLSESPKPTGDEVARVEGEGAAEVGLPSQHPSIDATAKVEGNTGLSIEYKEGRGNELDYKKSFERLSPRAQNQGEIFARQKMQLHGLDEFEQARLNQMTSSLEAVLNRDPNAMAEIAALGLDAEEVMDFAEDAANDRLVSPKPGKGYRFIPVNSKADPTTMTPAEYARYMGGVQHEMDYDPRFNKRGRTIRR